MGSTQVALVTGASSGIGQATAERLSSKGFMVFGTSRTADSLARSYRWLSPDVRSDISVEAAVQSLLDTNLLGVVRLIKAVLPVMRKQGLGRIINVSSVVGQVAPAYAGLYATSKFALEGLSEALREEVRPFGVDVSLVEPGFVKTHIVSQPPTNHIAAYTAGRQAAMRSLSMSVESGMEPLLRPGDPVPS